MPRSSESHAVFRFGVFEVDLREGELRKSGLRVKLQEQPFQLLVTLLERPGEMVSREELQRRLWPADTFVDFDHSLNNAIKKLREALGDQAENPRFIETLHRRGYRFIAPMDGNGTSAASASVESALIKKAGAEPRPTRGSRVGIALGLGAFAAILLLLVLGSNKFWSRPSATSTSLQIRSLAVLPLQNLSADPAQDYFSDGITEALITDLAQIGSLKVISRTSSMQYKQTHKPLPEIARELNVDGIVEGTVQRSGQRVRITTQLIHGASDKHVWAETYEGDVRDVLALESRVARSVSAAIEIQLTPVQKSRLADSPPIDQEAYDLYLKGRYFWNKRDREGLTTALKYFQQAAEKQP